MKVLMRRVVVNYVASALSQSRLQSNVSPLSSFEVLHRGQHTPWETQLTVEMSAPTLLALIVGLVTLPVYYIWCIVCNYSIAKRIGLRTVIVPGNLTSPVWLLLGPRLAALERWLTGGQNRLLRYGWLGFDFEEKARVHLELGDAFVIVTPGKNYVYLADSVAISHVFQTERRGDFVQPHEAVDMLSIFGPSISTASSNNPETRKRC